MTADPLFDPTDFTPGGGDTGTVLISPLIKPGTVSSTYYNHYSTLRTLEDLFLTGKSCTNPSNADTPLVAGTVCGGLDGQGHIGYAAQAGSGQLRARRLHRGALHRGDVPPGYAAVSGSGAKTLYCPVHVSPGQAGRNGRPGTGFFGGNGGVSGAAGCGTNGGNGGNGGNGWTRTARGERRQRRQRRLSARALGRRDLAHRGRQPDDAVQHAALQRVRRQRRQRGERRQRVDSVPGGNGGNGANGTPGRPGRDGTQG